MRKSEISVLTASSRYSQAAARKNENFHSLTQIPPPDVRNVIDQISTLSICNQFHALHFILILFDIFSAGHELGIQSSLMRPEGMDNHLLRVDCTWQQQQQQQWQHQ